MSGQSELGYCCGRKKPSCFGEVCLRCEGLQNDLNPGGLCLITFDVHVSMTCLSNPVQDKG